MLPRDLSERYLSETNSPSAGLPAGVDWESHLELVPLACWICSPDGSGLFMNLVCRRLLGVVLTDQLVGDKWVRQLHPQDRKTYLRAWKHFLESSTARFTAQVRWVRPDDGRTQRLQVRAQKIDSGKLQGWVREDTAERALCKLEEIAQ